MRTNELMDKLGLSEDELCATLGVDPLTIISGQAEDAPMLPILIALVGETEEQVSPGVIRRWLRTKGPNGRPIELLTSQQFPDFEDALSRLVEHGFTIGG